jgi:RimJ/RimL family protein N-acetyltransferase
VRGVLLGLGSAVLLPFVRHHRRLIWEVDLSTPRTPSTWRASEEVAIVGATNFSAAMTPALRSFVGADAAEPELDGVRRGDWLFAVREGNGFVGYSYIFFDAHTKQTLRQRRILGEAAGTPIIGLSYTAPAARGRGVYRRVLNDMFCFLQRAGHGRAICEVDPQNHPSSAASEAAGMRVCRKLDDWTILRHIIVQQVRASDKTHWRILWA